MMVQSTEKKIEAPSKGVNHQRLAWPSWRLIGLLLATTSCEPTADDLSGARVSVERYRRSRILEAPPSPRELRVMTWNIKYGAARIDFWFDHWGDRVQMNREEVEANLQGICHLLREVDPDIFLVQEIELNSRRSVYLDMVETLLECAYLNYAAYIPSWKSRYVPSEGLGRVDMGNAIFSKYKIVQAERIRQVDRGDQSKLIAHFYLHRTIGRATIEIGPGRSVVAYVVHTEAYDQDGTKDRHIEQIAQLVAGETTPFVLGGDFNELPPHAVRREGFPDEHPNSLGTEFEQPPYRPQLMNWFYQELHPWIRLAQMGETEVSQSRFYTHSVIGPNTIGTDGQPGFWNRTLDHMFVGPTSSWRQGASDVLQHVGRMGITGEPLFLSDHAPIVGSWLVDPGPVDPGPVDPGPVEPELP